MNRIAAPAIVFAALAAASQVAAAEAETATAAAAEPAAAAPSSADADEAARIRADNAFYASAQTHTEYVRTIGLRNLGEGHTLILYEGPRPPSDAKASPPATAAPPAAPSDAPATMPVDESAPKR